MSKRRLVDTNLIVRHLVQDHEKHAKVAGKLFESCDRGEIIIDVLPAVLAECVFVLESFYEKPRGDIAEALGALITSPGLHLPDEEVHLNALKRFQETKCHFVDCVLAATAAADNTPVATFDQDFRKFPDVQVKID